MLSGVGILQERPEPERRYLYFKVPLSGFALPINVPISAACDVKFIVIAVAVPVLLQPVFVLREPASLGTG